MRMTNAMIRATFKGRGDGEDLQRYYLRFTSLRAKVKWMRNVHGKPYDDEWEAETLKVFVRNLNSWAEVHVITMVHDKTLHDIVSKLQALAEIRDLDGNTIIM